MELDDWIARLAREPTVAAWSVHALSARSFSIAAKDGETGNAHAPATCSEGMSASWKIVWSDGRISRLGVDRSAFETNFQEWLRAAVAVAHDDRDATSVGAPSAMPDPALRSEDVESIARGDTAPLEAWLGAVRERIGPASARTWSGAIRASESESRVVTSAGLDVRAPSTLLSWHVTFDAESDCGHAWRTVGALDDGAVRLDRALETLRLLRTGTEFRGGPETPVLLHPDVVARWVVPTLLRNLSGRAVARGESAFRVEEFREGAVVVREDLTIEIDPLRPLHPGSYRFTAEGTPAARVVLVDRGRLATPVLDLKYAKRFGMPPTPSPLGTDSVLLRGSERLTEAAALDRASGGLLAFRALGVHTLDPTSGDFSLSAPQSLAIGSNGPLGRARANLVGNLFHALRDPFLALVDVPGEPQPGILLRCRVDAR